MRKFYLPFVVIFFTISHPVLAKDISPLILRVSSYPLTQEEQNYIKQVNPYGFVFIESDLKQNIDLLALKQDLTNMLEHKVYFFMDQEGGKVNRLKYLFPDRDFPSAEYYGKIAAETGLKEAKEQVFNKAKEMACLLIFSSALQF